MNDQFISQSGVVRDRNRPTCKVILNRHPLPTDTSLLNQAIGLIVLKVERLAVFIGQLRQPVRGVIPQRHLPGFCVESCGELASNVEVKLGLAAQRIDGRAELAGSLVGKVLVCTVGGRKCQKILVSIVRSFGCVTLGVDGSSQETPSVPFVIGGPFRAVGI